MAIIDEIAELKKRLAALEAGAVKTAEVLYEQFGEETIPAGKYGDEEVSY